MPALTHARRSRPAHEWRLPPSRRALAAAPPSPHATPAPAPLPLPLPPPSDYPTRLATADRALRADPRASDALLSRAAAAAALGLPHRALADLLRLIVGRGEGWADAHAAARAEELFATLSTAQHGVLRRVAVAEVAPQPSRRGGSAEGTSMCIYKVDSGNLLFREGVPLDATPRAGVQYPSDAGRVVATAPNDSPGPSLAPMEALPLAHAATLALEATRAGRYALVRGARAFDGSGKDARWWSEQLGEMVCHVLTAPAASSRFTYFWGGEGDTVHSHYDSPPTNHSEGMPFRQFVHRIRQRREGEASAHTLYLQTPLVKLSGGEVSLAPLPGAELRAAIRRLKSAAEGSAGGGGEGLALVRRLATEGQLGRYIRTALFASSAGMVTRLHYDHYDNVYLHVSGRKRVLLFAPLQARSLYPFPVHHPLDQRSRIHVDALPTAAEPAAIAALKRQFPRLSSACGWEVYLEPGDLLFIPHHWWHHVETTEGDPLVEGLALSLNLWFDFSAKLAAPRPPLSSSLLLELSRHVEFHLAALLGPLNVAAFLDACLLELAAPDGPPHAALADAATAAGLPRAWLVLRNALFAELAVRWVGFGGLRRFFDDLLYTERYRGLQRYEPEMLGTPRVREL
ncbi:hypothetical protein AB1Y20_002934 [Prymnesium parvum]|uniref:JmjC domain-containing protein n=1 Tax=Prymnesium parvum TaxID=97485 RepID=A0AB34JAK1_PRYPA